MRNTKFCARRFGVLWTPRSNRKHRLGKTQDLCRADVLRHMGKLGFLGIRYPAQYGGSEMDVLASVMLAEELGRSTFGGVAITVLVHTDMASVHLYNSATQAMKDHFMPDIISGIKIVAVAVTEPSAGSDVKNIRMTARRDGNDYVLNGTKMFVTNGVYADLYCVAAKTSLDTCPSQNISMFLVEKEAPGFRVGKKLEKHGWRSSDTAELIFDDCRIPVSNLLGDEGRGFYAIMQNFQNRRSDGRNGHGRSASRHRLDARLGSATPRFRFTTMVQPNDPHRLAMLATKIEAGRQLVFHAAWLAMRGIESTKEVSMVKAYCGELVNEVMHACLQFHGGMGFMRESTINAWQGMHGCTP